MPKDTFRVAALANQLPDLPLRHRGVDPEVVSTQRTEAGVQRYESLRQVRGGLKFAHGLMYFMISLTSLLAAIWIGLWFAGQFVAPIRRLISAAQQVTRGNLKVELPILRGEGDLRRLSMNFNAMTKELERQRTDLVTANAQLIERRRFMEAVLSGVSAGVIGLDRQKRITLASRSARSCWPDDISSSAARSQRRCRSSRPCWTESTSKGHPQHPVTLIINGEELSPCA
jgi:two-component system nitrogen regulation sensor histidine kinase NtrY